MIRPVYEGQGPYSRLNASDYEGINFAPDGSSLQDMARNRPMFHFGPGATREEQLRAYAPYQTKDNYSRNLNELRNQSYNDQGQAKYGEGLGFEGSFDQYGNIKPQQPAGTPPPQQQFPTDSTMRSGLSTVINPNQQNPASTGMSFSPSTNSFNPSMAKAGPNTPKWWSDTNQSWDPKTGLDIMGNYGGPIGTSGPILPTKINPTPNAGALAGVVGAATTQGNNMANIMTPVINPNITSTQTNAPVAPDWYNNYLSGLATSGQNAVNAGGIAGASPLQTAAYNAAPTAINAGQAPLQQATSTATGVATTPTSSLISQYMNPYTQDVVKSIGDLGRQQFREFTAPSVNAAGVATGQFGGSRAQDINAKAARDAAMNITAQQAQALNTGFQNSVTAAQNQQNLGLNSANVLGNLSGQAQGQATSGLNTLSTLGAQQQAINQAQLNYPMNALQNYGSLIAGQSIPIGSRQSVTGPAGSGQLGPSPFSQASQAATGLGALLSYPLASILGKGKEGTIGSGTLDWLKGLLGNSNTSASNNYYPTGYGTPIYSGDTGIGTQDTQGYFWDGGRWVDQRTFEEQFGSVGE